MEYEILTNWLRSIAAEKQITRLNFYLREQTLFVECDTMLSIEKFAICDPELHTNFSTWLDDIKSSYMPDEDYWTNKINNNIYTSAFNTLHT